MRLGYVIIAKTGSLDPVMDQVAVLARQRGLRLAGVVQADRDRPGRDRCDLELRLLPDGPMLPISLDLGPGSEGCRLDVAALEAAALLVAQQLPQADGLLVNRFGKIEAEGRGFVSNMAEAMGLGLPVLVGVAPPWLAAFQRFADGLATELPLQAEALASWMVAGRKAVA